VGSPAECEPVRRNRVARILIGARELIFKGAPLGFTEAPHLYKRDGYYCLITAEGGTGWGHAVTMARSRSLLGPDDLHPDMYILSSRHRPDAELQRAGHADLVETERGQTYNGISSRASQTLWP
jgi:xylan 1,4-beta-xylosidase